MSVGGGEASASLTPSRSHESGRVSEALAHVEAELGAIWAPDEGGPPKSRVCTCNLVVVSSPGLHAPTIALVDELRTADVARTFVVGIDPRLAPWSVQSAVSARCQRDGEGLACSERIDLTFGAAAIARASSVVSSLCVPEVATSVVLLEAAHRGLAEALAVHASRMVIDSEALGLEAARDLAASAHLRLGDLAWERLWPVRDLLASCFDAPWIRPALEAIHRVTLTTSPTSGDEASPQARLALGWLASRLGWRFTSSTSAVDVRHAALVIDQRRREAPGAYPGDLLGLVVEASLDGDAVRVELLRDAATGDLVAHTEVDGARRDTRQTAAPRRALAELIDRTLTDPHDDVALRQALAAAAGVSRVVVPLEPT